MLHHRRRSSPRSDNAVASKASFRRWSLARAGLATKLAPTLSRDKVLLVNLSGRGDKDMNTVAERTGLDFHR